MSSKPPKHVWPPDAWGTGQVTPADGVSYPMMWSRPVIDWLTGLHDRGDVEIRWHTTWQHEAQLVADLVGLPEFKVHDCPEWEHFNRNGSELASELIKACMPGWWKYPAAERVVTDEGRRLIWVDDDIDYQIRPGARKALTALYMLRLVSPADYTGITTKHIKIVDQAIARWKENPGGALSSS